jgi:hypothetical protein
VDEATWRATTNERAWMLEHVRTTAPARKQRLFACACVRRVWELLPTGCQATVEIVERVAEGELAQSELSREARLARLAAAGDDSPALQAVVLMTAPDPASFTHAATYALSALRARWREELAVQCDLARCVFGNPFRPVTETPAWARSETARQMAKVITHEGRYADLPILADALEDAGCADEDVLGHCRDGGWHGRGCWVLDVILGRG